VAQYVGPEFKPQYHKKKEVAAKQHALPASIVKELPMQ
jgi:hypothetical protein